MTISVVTFINAAVRNARNVWLSLSNKTEKSLGQEMFLCYVPIMVHECKLSN